MKYTFSIFAILAMFLSSCKKEDPVIAHPDTQKVSNLYAPADVRDQNTGQIVQENPFVYFSFKEGGAVDSTASWDIAFKGTVIITNSGVSGTGNAKSAIVNSTFADVTEAPADDQLRVDAATEYAIPWGSGNGWYNYNPTNHLISPIAGKVIVVKTNDGKYAKMEILSYYKDAPAQPNPAVDQGSTLTFNYVYQDNGTNKF
ncbi:MAG TPA: hypothetical protein ENK85_06025 [Saprospiraceae bacterium]|nr:hypothetical protein [Saprospiraceae bacterium]